MENYYYPFIHYQELYAPITRQMVPDIDENRYLVSNSGKVFDLWNNRYISQFGYYNDYQSVSLHLSTGLKKHVLLHRLVGMAFIPGDWNLQINHKDGKKTNCTEDNLEWVTSRENLMHALDTGLHRYGEDRSDAILTNNQVRIICEDLMQRRRISEILNHIGLPDTHRNRKLVVDVKRRKTFTRISKDYEFSTDILAEREFSNETVHEICRILAKSIA